MNNEEKLALIHHYAEEILKISYTWSPPIEIMTRKAERLLELIKSLEIETQEPSDLPKKDDKGRTRIA